MFRVKYDRHANILNMRVEGFWKPEDVAALAREVGAEVRVAAAIRTDFNVLVESFDFPVQANDVADLLPNIMHGGMTVTSGRAAVVVGSHLNKVQAERTLVHPRVQIFLTLEEGRAWLKEDVRPSVTSQT